MKCSTCFRLFRLSNICVCRYHLNRNADYWSTFPLVGFGVTVSMN